MPEDLTKSQIERLGVRLIRDDQPDPEDLELLHELLAGYSEVLGVAISRVREGIGVGPTSRIKNTGTILEKLDRYGGSWLKSIQDLAGMRIVGDFDRQGQDALVAQLVSLFSRERRLPRTVDRRADPMHGYAAVHVIVYPQGVPVEIQVRTLWQHEWAELFEKLADQVGRGIRYGERPTYQSGSSDSGALAPILSEIYAGAVRSATSLADVISAVETLETVAPDHPDLVGLRTSVNDLLATLRDQLGQLEQIDASPSS